MRRAWRVRAAVATAGAVMVWAGSLWAAGTASAYYTVIPICTAAGVSAPCSSGWYTSPVWIGWTWTPNTVTGESGCMTQSLITDVKTSVACSVQGPDGGGSATQYINVELSSPSAYGVATRSPDRNGWYNHPVAVAFTGSAFSGIQSCTSAVYAGPDSATATVSGSCTDNAGKVAPASFAFRYAASPPSVTLRSAPSDRRVDLRWAIGDIAPISRIRVTRTPGLRGHRSSVIYAGQAGALADHRVFDGVRYRYAIRVTDLAGNTSSHSIVVVPGPRLRAPAPGARLGAPPLLSWTPMAGATYYNVQIFRGGRKILSAWPRGARLALSRTWRFNGRRYRLRPGRYRWFVWPGFGAPAAARYGRVIGSRTFIIT